MSDFRDALNRVVKPGDLIIYHVNHKKSDNHLGAGIVLRLFNKNDVRSSDIRQIADLYAVEVNAYTKAWHINEKPHQTNIGKAIVTKDIPIEMRKKLRHAYKIFNEVKAA